MTRSTASRQSVVLGGARTPMGRMLGQLAAMSAVELGSIAIAAAVERAGVDPAQVDSVVMGQVLQAGAGQCPARQAAVRAGLSMAVPTVTINKVCLSGLAAVAMADQLIRLGEADIVVAGGMESMSNAPHLVTGSRTGFRYGDVTLRDHLASDGLYDTFSQQSMGALTDGCNAGEQFVSRADQDRFAARSHQRAAEAMNDGTFDAEITGVSIPQRKGDPIEVTSDEGVRPDATAESLAKLSPAFGESGTITAGSSSPISDGAAALVIAGDDVAEKLGIAGLARIGAYAQVAGPDSSLQMQPARSIELACRKAGIAVTDLDLIEINEAFAVVAVASARELGLDEQTIEQRVNVNGGAIALGHPVGASGARLALHLALELSRRGEGTAIASLCGGGGQGDALIFTAG